MAELDYFSLSESTLKELSDKGDPKAQLTLGMNYYYSAYGTRPVVDAYNYLVSAYNGGEKKAAPFIGEILYFKEVNVTAYTSDRDYFETAHRMFREAADIEMMAGLRGLAKMQIKGDYLKQDLCAAYYQLEQLKDQDEESGWLFGKFQDQSLTPDDIRPNVKFGKQDAEDPVGEEKETDDGGFNWKKYSDDDEMLDAWLSIDTPQEDGFELPLTVDDIKKDFDWDISMDIDESKFEWYDDYDGETVKDLLIAVIKSNDEAMEMLVELARLYRTMDGWELDKAAYWAHKAVILTRRLIDSDSIDYINGCEILCNALGELGNAYFSYPCLEDDTKYFPNAHLAAKYYEEAADADIMNEYDFNIMAGRAWASLGFRGQPEMMFLKKGFDRSKGLAWFGQMFYERGMIETALEHWNESIKGRSGWGEYFLGRYYWSRKYYSDAIQLWQAGEKKGCAECSGELFNWIIGHPESTAADIHKQWDKAMSLYGSRRCTSVYKYIYKHIMNGNIDLSFPEDPECQRLGIDRRRMAASNAIYKGMKEFCPYCAKIYKENLGFPNAGLAMKAWGFDGNVY